MKNCCATSVSKRPELYKIDLTSSAAREIRKLDRVAKDRVLRTIDILREDPHPPAATRLVGGNGLWRVRTGDYRIIYRIEDDRMVVVVVRAGHRKGVYRP